MSPVSKYPPKSLIPTCEAINEYVGVGCPPGFAVPGAGSGVMLDGIADGFTVQVNVPFDHFLALIVFTINFIHH